MRRILPLITAAAVATILAAALHASSTQPQATFTITVTGMSGSQAANVSGGQANLTSTVPIGKIGSNGTLSYNPGVDQFLAGKPLIVVVIQCSQNAQLQLDLWPQGQDPNAPMPPGCTRKHLKLTGLLWGKNITIDLTLAVADPGTTSSTSQTPFYKTPLGIGLIGGAIAAGVIVAAESGGGSTTGTTTPGSTFAFTSAEGTYAVTLTFTTNTCFSAPPATATWTVGGTQTAATLTGTLGSFTVNATLALTEGTTGASFTGSGTATGASATGGTFSGPITLTITQGTSATTNTITITESGSGACVLSLTGTGQG